MIEMNGDIKLGIGRVWEDGLVGLKCGGLWDWGANFVKKLKFQKNRIGAKGPRGETP
jgi:hypothetical protein